MGPDEFHEKYPGAESGGLNNNAYTNVLVSWVCQTALEILDLLPSRNRDTLRDALGITDDELGTWQEMSRKMFVPFHDDPEGGTVISQFEGYEELEELDWAHYRSKYEKIQRLDRILKAEGDDPDRYKLSKQADVLMLFYLFSRDELQGTFERLGYELDEQTAKRNADYYAARTSHGSTLSFIVHAHILADLDLDASWEMYMTALGSDVNDVQGGTTGEAIHLGVMAGTVDLIQRGYLGCEVRGGGLYFDPTPPEKLDGLHFPMLFRGTPMDISVSGGELSVAVQDDGQDRSVKVTVGEEEREIRAGKSHEFTF
jgi:trehalose/maltose hydrolase-like predicted phosphorylase